MKEEPKMEEDWVETQGGICEWAEGGQDVCKRGWVRRAALAEGWGSILYGGLYVLEGPGENKPSVGGLHASRSDRAASGWEAPWVRDGKGSKLRRRENGASYYCSDLPLQVTSSAHTEQGKIGTKIEWTLPFISSRRIEKRRRKRQEIKRRQTTEFRGSAWCPSAVVQWVAQRKNVWFGESPGYLGPSEWLTAILTHPNGAWPALPRWCGCWLVQMVPFWGREGGSNNLSTK